MTIIDTAPFWTQEVRDLLQMVASAAAAMLVIFVLVVCTSSGLRTGSRED